MMVFKGRNTSRFVDMNWEQKLTAFKQTNNTDSTLILIQLLTSEDGNLHLRNKKFFFPCE